MTASTATATATATATVSRSRSRSRSRSSAGIRRAGVLAIGAAAALTLSACGAGMNTQTNTQVAAVTGSMIQSLNGDITLNDVQVIAHPDGTPATGQYDIQFSASNKNVDRPYSLESITVDYSDPQHRDNPPVNLDIQGAPLLLCSVPSLATPEFLSSTLQTTTAHATTSPTGTATETTATETTAPVLDDESGTAEATEDARTAGTPEENIDTCNEKRAAAGDEARLPDTVHVDSFALAGTHQPGTSVEATFQFAGIEPMTLTVPVNLPHDVPREE